MALSSDRIRKKLAGIDPESSAPPRCTPGSRRRAHEPHIRRVAAPSQDVSTARGVGRSGCVVGSTEHRAAAGATASATVSDLREICCTAPQDIAAQRISARARTNHLVSDADASVATVLAGSRAPWPEARGPRPEARGPRLEARDDPDRHDRDYARVRRHRRRYSPTHSTARVPANAFLDGAQLIIRNPERQRPGAGTRCQEARQDPRRRRLEGPRADERQP